MFLRRKEGKAIYPFIERPTPVVDLLKKRPLLIERRRLIGTFGITDPPEEEVKKIKLDAVREMTFDELVTLIAKSDWAIGLAEGIAKKGGLPTSAPEFHKFVKTFTRAVAEGFARSIWERV